MARASLLKPLSSEEWPSRIFRAHFASASRGRPTATKSKSPRSKRRRSSSKELGVEVSPWKAAKKSPESPIEPTVIVDLPVSFLAHPAKRLHILRPGDLLTAIRIPSAWAGARFYFEKVRDRNVWDFALLNVASAMVVSDGRIERIRLAVNGAAARPLRLKAVEDAVRGKAPDATTGLMAGRLAVEGAVPLQFNAYKIPLMRNLVKRAIGRVEEAKWAS